MARNAQQTAGIAAGRPPVHRLGPIAWARANLFNGWFNTILTILIVWVLVETVPAIVLWAIPNAVWDAETADVCRAAEGACWPFVREKFRFVLFGTFPYAEHWRPFVAVVVFSAMMIASANRRFWNWRLAVIWAVGLAVSSVLMWGGAFGLTYVPNTLWGGLPLTIMLSVIGLAVAFPLSILLALGRRSDMPAIRYISVAYIELIRGVPLISLLFMASVMIPLFLPTGVNFDKLLRAQIAMIMFASAYMAEVIRGGLQAIPKGQYEAADALGLGYWQKTRKVILPQALSIVIPPMVNTFIGFFKDTSLVIIIGLFDLLGTTKAALTDPNWRGFYVEAYLFAALIYFAFCFAMSRYSQALERDLNRMRKR